MCHTSAHSTAQKRPIPTNPGPNDRVRAVAFAPDQRSVASASRDGCVAVWGLRLQPLFAIQAHMGYGKGWQYFRF